MVASLISSLSNAAIVYPAHSKVDRQFALALADAINADTFKVSAHMPHRHHRWFFPAIRRKVSGLTASFSKRVRAIPSCAVDIDRYDTIIIVTHLCGKHMPVPTLAFINSYYCLLAQSLARALVLAVGSDSRAFERDIERIHQLPAHRDILLELPVFMLHPVVADDLRTLDRVASYAGQSRAGPCERQHPPSI